MEFRYVTSLSQEKTIMSYRRRDVAYLLMLLIRRANFGSWPQSIDDWTLVAERFRLHLYVDYSRVRRPGVLYNRVIVVRWSPSLASMCERIAHEIAEYLLHSEWEAPYVVPSGNDDQERHALSRMIETATLYDA